MRLGRWVWLTVAGVGGACSVNDVVAPESGAPDVANDVEDAGTDVMPDVATPSFTFTLQPAHVTEDPGDQFTITINIVRTALTAQIDFTVAPPLGITTSQPAPALANTSTFDVSTDTATAVGDYDVLVTGTSGSLSQQVHLPVHVGSVYVLDGGAFTVPPNITTMTVKVWGAGGGGSEGCNEGIGVAAPGAGGGPGGYAAATITVVPGTVYTDAVGSGGGGGVGGNCGGSAGGGGYSALMDTDGGLIVLAGGGGGGGAGAFTQSGHFAPDGIAGGAGGGTEGASSVSGACIVPGGSQDAGGTSTGCSTTVNGQLLLGGNGTGYTSTCGSSNNQGLPGGGTGITCIGAGGGGGGGLYGGSGGSSATYVSPYYYGNGIGGGGGSGYNPFDGGTSITPDAGTPFTSDIDYGDAGTGQGGTPVASGNAGRIVIRLPKP